ncbi:type II toxin-antitoxin system RelE/ParE family toxin [Mucilaginibacter arboris]|uniref:Type II toxin-antitoxin system RelE/ParE family toxin n=1 Tax=Mucilaginibacter arboris TaxID=2682090 RepID=A0A7K1STQ2_9SPHI|nr:type II toxin-antitoxin system RelE/ParE family toxin [Mucilaginibacter arboris]MVN20685.1 hypothetical protein [Mucilaginibacter arboris]
MPYKIRTLNKANRELVEALKWYIDQQDDLASKFLEQFEKDAKAISINPESYPLVKKNFRQAPMAKFPYVILYSIQKKEEAVNIVSIFHTSQHPKRKFRK